jgi:cytochrome c oxidase subunit II
MSRTRVLAVAGAGSLTVALLVPAVVWGDAFTPESGGSPNADEIDSLYKLVFAVAIAVFVAVEGMLVYSLVRFRAKRGRVAAQIHGNTRLEVAWTLGAALILAVLTVITFLKLGAITNPTPAPAAVAATAESPSSDRALRVEVSGQQYIWRFRYPGGVLAYEEMVVPTGTTVRLDIVSEDVAHSWWVPKLGGKADAIPGYTNHTWFRIARPGVFRGQCAELCGRNHADMIAHVRAVSPPRFRAWLAAQQRGIADARAHIGSTPVTP